MRPTRRDPCKVCGQHLIEHDNEPFDVKCGFCQLEARKPWKCQDCKCELTPGNHNPQDLRCWDCWTTRKAMDEPQIIVQMVQPEVSKCAHCRASFEHLPGHGTDLCFRCDALLRPMVKLVPTPTVEWRLRGQVPYAAGLLAYTVLAMGAGFLMGLAMHGC